MSESATELQTTHPNLAAVVESIRTKSIFQKKAVHNLIAQADARFLDFGNDLVLRLNRALGNEDGDFEFLAQSYVDYTKMIRREDMHFAKKGEYSCAGFEQAYENIYGREDYMRFYVAGLGMTQIFWNNHYEIVRFFLDEFAPKVAAFTRGAEVGIGHGLFHTEMLRAAPNMTSTMLDISPVPLKMAHGMMKAIDIDPNRAEPVCVDVQKEIPLEDGSLDALLMGEFIEHIEDGDAIMKAFGEKMRSGGLCFFTTAANAPAEDHILLFRNTGEIRDLVNRNGWDIVQEHFGTLRGMSVEEAEEGGHNINYAAILTIP